MRKGKPLSKDAREIIYKVHLFFSIEAAKFKASDGYFQRVQSRVAKATGVSKKYVYKIAKEMDATWQEQSFNKLRQAMGQIEEIEDDSAEEQPEKDEAGSSINTDTSNSIQLSLEEKCVTARKRPNILLPHGVSKIVKKVGKQKVEHAKPRTVKIMPKMVTTQQVHNEEPTASYSIINAESSVPALVPIQPNTQKTIQYLPAGSSLIKIKTVPNLTPIHPKYELNNVRNVHNIQLGSKLVTLVPVPQNPDAAHLLLNNRNQIVPSSTAKGKLYSEVPARNNIQDSKWSGLVKKPAQQKKIVIKKIQNAKPKVTKPKEQAYIQVEAKTVPIEFDPIFTNTKNQIKMESIEILD